MTQSPNRDENLLIKDARLIFRNFAGRPGMYTSEGDRLFHVILEKEQALELLKRGWRVKQLKPREEGEEGDYHLKVKVNYKSGRPPRVVLISSKSSSDLGMDEVAMVDSADIAKADLMINGWWSEFGNAPGYSAFLKSAFITLNEDELEREYAQQLAQTADVDASEWGEE